MNVNECSKCKWLFEKEHTEQCPQCGVNDVVKLTDMHWSCVKKQTKWSEIQKANFEGVLRNRIDNPICCWTAKHSNGWRHDTKCKNHVICY